jgi:type II secretory pathway component PulK
MTRRGTVLVAVMVLTVLSAMVAAGLLYFMQSEVTASASAGNGEQAYAAAMSGLQRALAVLRTPDQDWSDNPEMFANQLVADDGSNKWYFTVYAPSGDDRTLRYGLEDEASKINLNVCTEAVLKALLGLRKTGDADPNELADCLLDYRDADNNPRTQGAEQDYYDKLPHPYVIKNGPLGTLEELLLVKGFTGPIVYGEDANMNGILDPNENDGDKTFPPDDADGVLDRGLMGLATVLTHEPNTDRDGKARISLSGTDADIRSLEALGLKKETVDFIRICRADGVVFTHPSQLLEMEHKTRRISATAPATQPGNPDPNAPEVTIRSGVTADELPIIMDKLTALPPAGKGQLLGLVNVNTASAQVLGVLPGMDENLARTIVQTREGLDGEKKSTIAWLYTENLVPADKFKEIAPSLTARSLQYHVRCVGFGSPCGRRCVIEAIVDFAAPTPRVVYLRDITRLGLPAAMDVEKQEHRQ